MLPILAAAIAAQPAPLYEQGIGVYFSCVRLQAAELEPSGESPDDIATGATTRCEPDLANVGIAVIAHFAEQRIGANIAVDQWRRTIRPRLLGQARALAAEHVSTLRAQRSRG